jgi:site-specific recombinase XerD
MDLVPAKASAVRFAAEPPARENPYLVYLTTLTGAESRRAMAGCLDRIAAFFADGEVPENCGRYFPWGTLRYLDTSAIRTMLQEQATIRRGSGEPKPWSAAYINKHLSALRGVLEQAWMLEQMPAEDYHRAVKIKNLKGTRVRPGRNIADPEIGAILAACLDEGTLAGKRDAAMTAVLHSTGLRREELATAARGDYDPGGRTLLIVGKGDKQREVYIHDDAAVYLGIWITATEQVTGPLFCPIDRWGHVGTRHMTPRAIGFIVDRRRLAAKLPRLAPHDFRRTFAGSLLNEGVDLLRVQQLMGHSSPVTTSLYDRRPSEQRKAAVDLLHLPSPDELSVTPARRTT